MNFLLKILAKFSNENMHSKEMIKGGMVGVFSNFSGLAFGYFTVWVTTTYFGTTAYGGVNLISSILAISLIFSVFGFQTLTLKILPQYQNAVSKKFAIQNFLKMSVLVLIFSLLTFALLFFFRAKIMHSLFEKVDFPGLFYLLMAFLIVRSQNVLGFSYLRGFKQFLNFSKLTIFQKALSLFLIFGSTLFFVPSFQLLIRLNILADLIILIIFASIIFSQFYRVKNEKTKPLISTKVLFFTASPMIISSISNVFIKEIDKLMIGYFQTVTDVGYYSIAVKLSTTLSTVLIAINTFSASKFSELFTKGMMKDLEIVAQKNTQLIFWFSFPLAITLMVFGSHILGVFGQEMKQMHIPLVILVIAQLVNSCCGSVGGVLNMTGYQKTMSKILFSAAILNVILNAISIPKFGIMGAAVSTAISIVYWNLTATYFLHKYHHFKIYYFPFITKR